MEGRLQNITEAARRRTRELDRLFDKDDLASLPKVPPVPKTVPKNDLSSGRAKRQTPKTNRDGSVRTDTWEDFAGGEFTSPLFERPESFRDLREKPPILVVEAVVRKGWSAVRRFSEKPEVALPERVYAVQLTADAGDDAAAGEENNRGWRDALEQKAEVVEQLWSAAEDALATVTVAEGRAEARRPRELLEFRERTQQALTFAYGDPDIGPQQLGEWLETLQTDKRLLAQLARLEDLVLELEGCRNEMATRSREAQKFPEKSEERRRKLRQCDNLQERISRVKFLIRTIGTTARELPETDEAFRTIGEAIAGLNPFR